MSGPPNSNGVLPETSAPPSDVAPTTSGYGITIGCIEYMSQPSPVPPWMLEEGISSFDTSYEFEEYALEVQNGEVVRVNLSGDTINWSQSALDESGDLEVNMGITVFYSLVGKTYVGHQYTFLDFSIVLVENGVPKPASWTVRMKHYN